MRKIFIVALLFSVTASFAQQGLNVSGNKITVKEIAPIWPGCENNENNKDSKACFNSKLMTHIKENYVYPKNDNGEIIRGKAIAKLEVNKEGKVVLNAVEGNNPKINAAVEEMVMKMPKMKPGEKAGKPAAIKYTIPLTL